MYRGGEVAKIEVFLDVLHEKIKEKKDTYGLIIENKETSYALVRLFFKLKTLQDVHRIVGDLVGNNRENMYTFYVGGIKKEIFDNAKITSITREFRKIVLDALNFIKFMLDLIKVKADEGQGGSFRELLNHIDKACNLRINNSLDPFFQNKPEDIRAELKAALANCDELVNEEMLLYDNLPVTETKLAMKIFLKMNGIPCVVNMPNKKLLLNSMFMHYLDFEKLDGVKMFFETAMQTIKKTQEQNYVAQNDFTPFQFHIRKTFDCIIELDKYFSGVLEKSNEGCVVFIFLVDMIIKNYRDYSFFEDSLRHAAILASYYKNDMDRTVEDHNTLLSQEMLLTDEHDTFIDALWNCNYQCPPENESSVHMKWTDTGWTQP